MPMILAVLDTNVLVSALCLPESLPANLLRRWLARQFVLILSEQILAELLDVLGRPKIVRRFAMTDQKAQAFIQVLRDLAITTPAITTPGELTVEAVPDDPKDNHVVACAMEGEADYIVSGDQHLKKMKEYQSVYILSPAQFQAVLQQASGQEGDYSPA